ncbi:unnamed protein product [Somion occarium]|uniref:Phosphoglycerate mutase-like protein n=1 Tax=Somion occarium TaxID=3059160 RepID=A0ABP1CJP0_9APHY
MPQNARMTVETIYIARHGYRLSWVTTTWKSETDYFLSIPLEQRPTAIFSSPYYRCLQTAQPVSIALGVPIYVEHGLSEWYSPVVPGSGLHPRPASASELKAYFSEIDDSWQTVYYPSRKGEDVKECHVRAGRSLNRLLQETERKYEGKHKRILLMSHAATTIALTRELVGNRELSLRVGCCSITEVQRKPDGCGFIGGWEALRLASGAHLKEGSTRDWGFEDITIADGKVIADPGQPGSEHEVDEPVGCQVSGLSSRM